jgi:uncharacterized damage-inducible protein DinB
MIAPEYCLTMAGYNAWMNERLYAVCETLPDELRKRDLNAFFRSIHATLDHILAVDRMFLSHFKSGTRRYLPEGGVFDSFEDLERQRKATDAELLDWSGTVSPEWLAERSSSGRTARGMLWCICSTTRPIIAVRSPRC